MIYKYAVMLILSSNVFAGEIGLKLESQSFLRNNSTMSPGTSNRIELNYSSSGKEFFFISKQTIRMQIIYPDFYYEIDGIGIGGKIQLNKSMKVFSQIGYYNVTNSIGNKVLTNGSEAIPYYLNDRFKDATGASFQSFSRIGVVNENSIGGSIGIEFDYGAITTSVSYRILKFGQSIRGYFDESRTARHEWWEANTVLDLSSFNIGFGFKF